MADKQKVQKLRDICTCDFIRLSVAWSVLGIHIAVDVRPIQLDTTVLFALF